MLVQDKSLGRGYRKVFRFAHKKNLFERFYGNNTTAFIPEMWANEAVALLWENMLYASLVHTDFKDEIAEFGRTVHTRSIGNFTAKRKQNDLDDVEDQDITATDIAVVLNQRAYNSFLVGDGQRSYAFKDLIAIYLEPAMLALARLLDQVVAGQVYQFLANRAGGLDQLTSVNGHDFLLDSREVMNTLNVPEELRWMGLATRSETYLQKTDLFKSAERRGDGGRALREALLGRVAGWNNFYSKNTPSVRGATLATTTTTTAAALAGSSTVVVASATNLATGAYFTVAGDYTPLRVSALNTLTITTTRPLLRDVANGATVTPVATGLINQGSAIAAGDFTLSAATGYPAGWMKTIVVDGTGVPKVGQLVAFKTAAGAIHTAEYCIVQVISATEFMLDRPLEQAVLDNDIVCYGPSGDYNFGFRRGAIALVNRPIALPESGIGARAAQAIANGMSMRVVMTYDGKKEATRINVGSLFGIKTLDVNQGLVMLG